MNWAWIFYNLKSLLLCVQKHVQGEHDTEK